MTAFSTEERARLRALYEAFENPKGDSEAWGAPVETIDLADELIPAFPALMDALEQAENALLALVNDMREVDWYYVPNDVQAQVNAVLGERSRHNRKETP